MTAQPEVVWVDLGNLRQKLISPPIELWDAYREGSAIYGRKPTPYVPQASLTAALAERDEARRELALQEIADHGQAQTLAELKAERDKLAKALGEATEILRDVMEHQPTLLMRVEARVDDFLTAQAAQGEKK